jgi:hypothetical protein
MVYSMRSLIVFSIFSNLSLQRVFLGGSGLFHLLKLGLFQLESFHSLVELSKTSLVLSDLLLADLLLEVVVQLHLFSRLHEADLEKRFSILVHLGQFIEALGLILLTMLESDADTHGLIELVEHGLVGLDQALIILLIENLENGISKVFLRIGLDSGVVVVGILHDLMEVATMKVERDSISQVRVLRLICHLLLLRELNVGHYAVR